jgi:hexosaminidase
MTVFNPTLQTPVTDSTSLTALIPKPVSVDPAEGSFMLSAGAIIYVDPATSELTAIGQYLADKLNPATGYKITVAPLSGTPAKGSIVLTTNSADATLGDEGYQLAVTPDQVTLRAPKPAGLFWGSQTIRQLLPPRIESASIQSASWTLPTGTIRDYPRFAWRGAMLDVARHFFGVTDVEHYIDLLAYYKLNRFHLHLTDDQGWRLAIDGWPKLTTEGGSTAVGGDAGGYYTKDDYSAIVAYAAARYITVVPEIDMPGHSNAALASYAELNCNGVAPALYTGTEVGFSSFCASDETTYRFLTDVIKEVAALTPGPYIHIGGDESKATQPDDYVRFVERVQSIVQAAGKQMVGWEEIVSAHLLPTSIAQDWNGNIAQKAVTQGAKVILSPASKAYLDMKYDPSTPLGQNWAGYVNLQTGYDWNPATQLNGVTEADILGVEAPLWTETIRTLADIEYMAFPRLPGYAEIGWSAADGRNWDEYKTRLSTYGVRWDAMGVKYFHASEIDWP